MKRVLFVVAAVMATSIGLGACSDTFSPPQLPDLHKDPYDFAIVVPPFERDGGGDLAGIDVHDLSPTD